MSRWFGCLWGWTISRRKSRRELCLPSSTFPWVSLPRTMVVGLEEGRTEKGEIKESRAEQSGAELSWHHAEQRKINDKQRLESIFLNLRGRYGDLFLLGPSLCSRTWRPQYDRAKCFVYKYIGIYIYIALFLTLHTLSSYVYHAGVEGAELPRAAVLFP